MVPQYEIFSSQPNLCADRVSSQHYQATNQEIEHIRLGMKNSPTQSSEDIHFC